MSDRLPIVPLPVAASPEALKPPAGWWRDGFLWRLKWGAEGRVIRGDGKRAKAVLALIKSPRFQRFAEYFFAVDAEGHCRYAVRPLFHPTLKIEYPIWSQPLPHRLRFAVQTGTHRKRRVLVGVELLSAEQVRQVDAGAALVLSGFTAFFDPDARISLEAPRDLDNPGTSIFVAHMSTKRAAERGIGVRELQRAKYVAGRLLVTAATYYWDWPDKHGRQDLPEQLWAKLTPRFGAVVSLTELISGTSLTEDEVKAVWTASEQNPPFHPTYWPNSKT
jgi:hypothetical protein